MKKTLLVTFWAICMLAWSTFASGEVTTGSTLTGSTTTGTVLTGTTSTWTVTTWTTTTWSTATWAICMNNATQVKNDSLKAIALAFTTSIKASLAKKDAAIAAARASGKTEDEIKALVKAARKVWKEEVRTALKVAKEARKAATKTFEQQKDSCKSKGWKKWRDYRKKVSDKIENHKNKSHNDDDNDDD